MVPPIHPLTWRDDRPAHVNNNYEHCHAQPFPNEECDFQAFNGNPVNQHPDNTHPSLCGRDKVSNLMMYFYCNSPYTVPWFTTSGSACTNLPPLNNSCSYGQGSDAQ